MARPFIEINRTEFIKLCQMQCTLKEIAGWFECSEDTIQRYCKREFEQTFTEVFDTFSAKGKISLRRTQFKMAETNCSMAIWLGKQYLGQKEQQDVAVTYNDDETIRKMSEYFSEQEKDTETD